MHAAVAALTASIFVTVDADGYGSRTADEIRREGIPLKRSLLLMNPLALLWRLREQCEETALRLDEPWATYAVAPQYTATYKPAGKAVIIVKPLGGYLRGNVLGDVYNERARLMGRRYDQAESPMRTWDTHFDQILQTCRDQYGQVSRYYMRESLWRFTRECTAFPPALMSWVISTLGKYDNDFWKQEKLCVLDPCSGYGDRLIGAIVSQRVSRYIGVDPNTALHGGYADIQRDLPTLTTGIYMHCRPFEDIAEDVLRSWSGGSGYDLVFTSPPFFTTELYEEHNTGPSNQQSTSRYPTLDQWLQCFLWPLLIRSMRALRPGGYLVVHLQDVPGIGVVYVERTLKCMAAAWGEQSFCGAIGFGKYRAPGSDASGPSEFLFVQPLWVWRRCPPY
jgi:hypothetical protein